MNELRLEDWYVIVVIIPVLALTFRQTFPALKQLGMGSKAPTGQEPKQPTLLAFIMLSLLIPHGIVSIGILNGVLVAREQNDTPTALALLTIELVVSVITIIGMSLIARMDAE